LRRCVRGLRHHSMVTAGSWRPAGRAPTVERWASCCGRLAERWASIRRASDLMLWPAGRRAMARLPRAGRWATMRRSARPLPGRPRPRRALGHVPPDRSARSAGRDSPRWSPGVSAPAARSRGRAQRGALGAHRSASLATPRPPGSVDAATSPARRRRWAERGRPRGQSRQ